MKHRQFMQLLLAFVVVFALAFTITSCKKTDNITTPTNGGGSGLSFSTLGLYLPNLPSVSGILGALKTKISYSGIPVDAKLGVAGFFGSGGAGSTIYAGDVKVNGTSLDTVTNSTNVFYMAPSLKNPFNQPPLNFADTSVANFVVAGLGSITGFSASINTPIPALITFPGSADSVSKSADFTITWSGASTTDSVIVVVMDKNSHTITKIGLPNTGTCTVLASEMSSFTAGSGGTVILVKFRYTITNQGGNNYALVAETVNTGSVKFY